jgi:DNA-directed RNA polymerase specialized sigma24 family protein
MIDWVGAILITWGRKAARLENNGLGYRSIDSSCRGWMPGRSFDVTSPNDVDDGEFDRLTAIIESLPMAPRRPLRAIVVVRYRDGWTFRRIGGFVHMPQQTVRDRLSEAHTLIARALTEEKIREKMD